MVLNESALASRYRPRVVYFVLRRLRDRNSAEEIAQATLLVLIEAIRENRIREEESVGSFIFGVANNLIREHLREKARQAGNHSLEDANPGAVWGDDPEAALLLAEQRQLVREALTNLSREDELLLTRLSQSWRSQEEIAAEFGISFAALRKRKSRALTRLKEISKVSQRAGD